MKIDRREALRHLLLTLGFCVVVAAVEFFFDPARPFLVKLVYSVATGVPIWAIVEFGRLLLVRPPAIGWPSGWRGPALVVAAIVAGYLIGVGVGDWWFGWSSWPQQRDRITAGMIVTLLAGAVASSYFYLQGRNTALLARAETAQRQAAESRLKLLQSQLDPHLLFNTLANLRSLIDADPARALAMLDRLHDYLRATLSASRATLHPLAAEFDRLRDYLELMAVRMGSRLTYSLELPSALASLPIPTLLLQPLVENSIRHGLEPSVTGGTVRVRAWLDGSGALCLEVADSGCGLVALPPSPATAGAAGGFGLAQVRERLDTQYGSAARLSFVAQPAVQPSQAALQAVTIRIEQRALRPN